MCGGEGLDTSGLTSCCSSSADIQQKDREVLELLQERVTLFSDLAELTKSGEKSPNSSNTRNLFRLDTPHAPHAEKRLTDAISEGRGVSLFWLVPISVALF